MTTPKSFTPQPGDSTHPNAAEISAERTASVDFDLFGRDGATDDGTIDLAAEARASARAAGASDRAVDFDVFGVSEPSAATSRDPARFVDTAIMPARPAAEDADIGFDIAGSGKVEQAAGRGAVAADDDDMNADDATRFHAPPRERAANAAPSVSPIRVPQPALIAPTQATGEGSGSGKIVAIIVLVIAALAAAWWFLR